MQFYGNTHSRQVIRQSLKDPNAPTVTALVGPSHLGKRSFVEHELKSTLVHSDLLFVDSSVADAREAAKFCYSLPIFSPFKIVVIDNADKLSEPAQDAYLKLCEETPLKSRVMMITEDDRRLLPALRSRIRQIIKWYPLDTEEMVEFAGCRNPRIFICNGRPGLYELITEELIHLHDLVSRIIIGLVNPIIVSTPKVILDLPNKLTPMREAISIVCSSAAKSVLPSREYHARAVKFAIFANELIKHPQINADIYWQKSCLIPSM